MKDDGDIILIERAKRNGEYFGDIYNKYADRVCKYFLSRVGFDKNEVEDLTEETFIRAFEHLHEYQHQGHSYCTYLFAIAHNLLVNHYRDKKTVSLEEVGDIEDGQRMEISARVEMRMEAQEIWHAVDALPHHERETLLMRYKKEMSVKEIAGMMHKTTNAIKLTLSRGRKKLMHNACICRIHTEKECDCGGTGCSPQCACRTGFRIAAARR